MNPSTTSPSMPMASRLPITQADLLPPLSVAPQAAPPPPAAGMMAGPGGTPLGGFPDASAPAEPPYVVEMQPDGSAIWKSKTEPPIVIGVVPAPRLPVSMQPPKS